MAPNLACSDSPLSSSSLTLKEEELPWSEALLCQTDMHKGSAEEDPALLEDGMSGSALCRIQCL